MDYEFIKIDKDGFHLNIASTIPEEELETSGV